MTLSMVEFSLTLAPLMRAALDSTDAPFSPVPFWSRREFTESVLEIATGAPLFLREAEEASRIRTTSSPFCPLVSDVVPF